MLLNKIKNGIRVAATCFVYMLAVAVFGHCAACFVDWSFDPVLNNISGIPQAFRCIVAVSVFMGCLWVVCDDGKKIKLVVDT